MIFCKNLGLFVLLVLHVILRCSLALSIDQLSDGKTANQIINGLSRPQLQELLNMIENNNVKSDSNSDSCSNKFLENKNKIIRTEESIQNGAKFLKASTKQMSAESCKQLCCDYTDPNNQHTCDLSVIQLSGGGGGKPCCFLFSCTNHSTGKFNCLFSNHDGYNTYRKTLEPVAVQPNNDVIELQEVLETSTTSQTTTTTTQTTTISTTKPTTTKSTTTTKEPTTESTTTKPTTTTTEIITTTSTTSTTKISPTTSKRESCKKQCSHHEWSCDDGCCIHAHLVCDNTNHCNDGSDETDCGGLQSQPPLVSPTNQTLKVNPVTQKIDTNVQTHNPMVEVEKIVVEEKSLSPEQGAVLPLALGLAVTACIILMVVCRVRVMRKKLRRNGGPLRMDESDYLINGMYL